jgi:hypothetical protein
MMSSIVEGGISGRQSQLSKNHPNTILSFQVHGVDRRGETVRLRSSATQSKTLVVGPGPSHPVRSADWGR